MRVDGGVADDDVDASKRPAALLDQVFEFFLAPHVAREAQHGEPLVAQLPLRRLDPACIPAGNDDSRAVLGERARDGLADALGRAGDDGALAVRSKRGDMAVSGLRVRQPDHATARNLGPLRPM